MSFTTHSKKLLSLFYFLILGTCLFAQTPQHEVLDSLEIELEKELTDSIRLTILKYVVRRQALLSTPEKGIKYSKEGIALAQKMGKPKDEVDMTMRMLMSHPFPDTDTQMDRALHTIKASGDSIAMAQFHLLAGQAYWHYFPETNYEKALSLFYEGLTFLQNTDHILEAYLHSNIAAVYAELEEYEKVFEHYDLAIAMAEAKKEIKILPVFYGDIASMHQHLGNIEEAKIAVDRALETAKMGLHESAIAYPYIRAATLATDKDTVKIYFRTGIQLADKYELIVEQMEGLRQYIRKLTEYGELKEASNVLDEFSRLTDSLDMPVHKKNRAILSHDIFTSKGNYKSALEEYTHYKSWSDTLLQQKRNEDISNAEVKYETKKKELENIQLKESASLLSTQKRLYTALAIGGFALSTLALVLFYRTRKQNKTIETQNKRLENLNATKDRFFAIIAHDLRAPVIDFKGITKTIGFLAEKNDVERIKQIGKHVDKAANNLSNLLDNLLNWALLQKGTIPYNPEIIDLAEVSNEALNIYKNIAEQKGVILENNISSELKANADKNAVFTIFSNLLNNSIKFTEHGGKVSLSAKLEKGKVYLEVNDTGTGIAAHQLNNLFELNEQKRSRGTAGEKGTGLGLVLVKELVELNKGTIRAISEIGKGSQFIFALPQ